MKNFAKFEIIGNVGTIDSRDNVTHVSVAANYRRRTERDEWTTETYWNRVTVFGEPDRRFIADHVGKGDLVRIVGRLRDSEYERNGEKVYTVDRLVDEFDLLARRADLGD